MGVRVHSVASTLHRSVLLKKHPWSTYICVFAGSLVLAGYFQTTDSARRKQQVSSSFLVRNIERIKIPRDMVLR